MITSLTFIVLGIAICWAGMIAPFDQGMNHLLYLFVGGGIILYGFFRKGRLDLEIWPPRKRR